MEGLDNISDNYRNQVDKLLDDQSVLSQFGQLNQDEIDNIWEEVSAEIDIEEVWSEISSDLHLFMPEDSGSDFNYRSLAVLLIILSAFIPGIKETPRKGDIHITYNSVETSKSGLSSLNITDSKQEPIKESGKVVRNVPPAIIENFENVKRENNLILGTGGRAVTEQSIVITIGNGIVSKVLDVPDITDADLKDPRSNNALDKSDIPLALVPGDPKKINIISQMDYVSLKLPSQVSGSSLKLTDRGKISGGFITSVRNTWLLNHETFDGLGSESLNTTSLVFFPDVGLCMNYSLNKSWMLQADGFLFSNTGQKYHEYINGHYSLKSIKLRYSLLALSVKYNFSAGRYFPPGTSINLHAGPYASVLQNANQKINADLENLVSHYRKYDFGVRIGGEIEFPVTENMSIAPGLSLSLGVPNIYKGSGNIPGYLRATRNASEGFTVTFYYHFK